MKLETILFATVQNSGARFLVEHHDMKLVGLNSGGNVIMIKLTDANMPQILEHIAAGGEVWTTDRSDENIRDSWIRRGRDLAELDRQLANRVRILPHAKVLSLPGNLKRLTAEDKRGLV